MKNLAQFKRKLAEHLAAGKTVDFAFKCVTLYGVDHPGREKYPEGLVYERVENGCKLGRVQSQAFTRMTEKGTESWLYFGPANEWTFPNDKTAVCTGGSYEGRDHSVHQTLTYTFND